MDTDFWTNKWEKGDIGFHQSTIHPQLEKFGKRLGNTVLVPLCGKSLDMLYLSSKGHAVIGVELSPLACRSFFEENGISFTEKTIGDFLLFKSESITLWCGDFFNLPVKVWENVSGVYDRASLIALPQEMRERYAAMISGHLNGACDILLISVEYSTGALQGPPFSVDEKEIRGLFNQFTMEKLDSKKIERPSRENPGQTVELIETVYWLSKS